MSSVSLTDLRFFYFLVVLSRLTALFCFLVIYLPGVAVHPRVAVNGRTPPPRPAVQGGVAAGGGKGEGEGEATQAAAAGGGKGADRTPRNQVGGGGVIFYLTGVFNLTELGCPLMAIFIFLWSLLR